MNVDIDSFIKEQKSKIATERQYLSNQNLSFKRSDSNYNIDDIRQKNYQTKTVNNNSSDDNFVFKMKEGENMKNRYKQELRNDFTNINDFNKHVGNSSRKEKLSDNNDNNGLLPGLGYSNSANQRKENIRNQEYNEFKKIDEQNFKNRFLNKKNGSLKREIKSDNNLFYQRNPITSEPSITRNTVLPMSAEPKRVTISTSPPPERFYERESNKSFENKLDMLEKKVDDLRRMKIQDVNMITYSNGSERFDHDNMANNNTYERSQLSRPHLRSLEEAERKLNEIDQKYDQSKSRIMKNLRSETKKISSILDDDSIFQNENLNQKFTRTESMDRNTSNNYRNSIIPMGRSDEDNTKRKKQEQYRRDLEDQMKEKSQKLKRTEFNSTENISFFDRFGSNNNIKKVNSARSELQTIDKDNEYLYYASRNPLDDYENNNYIPSSININNPILVNDIPNNNNSFMNIGSRNQSYHSNDKQHKGNYGEELKKQIEERKIRKEVEKKKQDEYERRKNEEISNYDPFGRGGGGAPLKDNRGETITDLKNLKFDNITIPPDSFRPKIEYHKEPEISSNSNQNDLKTFARGGHGIFGQALTEEAKIKSERYKEELSIQIDNKRRQKEIEKESERIRDAKEREKFEKEQKQIQLELENEKKLQQQKEIERIQRLEESKLAAKEKKAKERIEVKMEEPIKRSPSPYQYRESPKPKTPLIIKESKPLEINQETFDITNKLHILRNEIKIRAAQVEKDIARQNDEVEIYDPRLAKHNQLENHKNSDYNTTIFQSVLDNKGPLSVRRNNPKPKTINENPRINTEATLDEYLKQQEKVLARMGQNDFSPFELSMEKMNPRDLGMRPQSQMSNQLESETNFITFNQSREFPLKSSMSNNSDNNFHFIKPQSPKPFKMNYEFGSNTSLNIDDLTRKNKQRLRKLQKTQHDNDNNESTEEILNKLTSLDNKESYSFNGV